MTAESRVDPQRTLSYLPQRRVLHALLAIAAFAYAACGCKPSAMPASHPGRLQTAPEDVNTASKTEIPRSGDTEQLTNIGPELRAFCSRCHALPEADEAPREAWRGEVEQAFKFHKDSPAHDEPTPDFEAVVKYFERQSIPYSDFIVPPLGDVDPGCVRFSRTEVRINDAFYSPALAGLTWIGPQQDRQGALLASDMRSGGLYSISPAGEVEAIFAPDSKTLSSPCHLEPCDLDGDGLTDMVVADLGQFYPADHQFGRVVWLRKQAEGRGYEPIELAVSLGRVADVQPGDFDADGDQDLIVAEFGLYATGRLVLLENQQSRTKKTEFELKEVDSRHGAIHVPAADLNGDDRLDFVALFSQEHEAIEAFLNRGDGTFEKRSIYKAPNPSWASSGIQLIDLDVDGDLDVLYSNGDSFDREYLKPYHGIRWLENQGDFPWVEHHLADMPGCMRALAGDLDGDGDLDIVAAALVPAAVRERFGQKRFDALCWFEQKVAGQFHRRSLELAACDHAALAVADFDGDGDLDLALGHYHFREAQARGAMPFLTLWRNETERAGAPGVGAR